LVFELQVLSSHIGFKISHNPTLAIPGNSDLRRNKKAVRKAVLRAFRMVRQLQTGEGDEISAVRN